MERRQKIDDLKRIIKTTQKEITESIKARVEEMKKDTEEGLSTEELKKKSEEGQKSLAIRNATLRSATEELKVVRMNRNSSSFFSWEPHRGMNRRSARLFRRLNKKAIKERLGKHE